MEYDSACNSPEDRHSGAEDIQCGHVCTWRVAPCFRLVMTGLPGGGAVPRLLSEAQAETFLYPAPLAGKPIGKEERYRAAGRGLLCFITKGPVLSGLQH